MSSSAVLVASGSVRVKSAYTWRLQEAMLAGEPAYVESPFINQLKAMPVRFAPAAASA